MSRWLLTGIAVLVLCFDAATDDWPAWRGPQGNGVCTEKNVPLKWDRNTNVCWKVKLPMGGNSTPVIWQDRIFLTQSLDKKGHERALMCFARRDGKLLWQKVVRFNEAEPTHATNPYCSASPVTDGERVIVSFGSAGLFCYDLDGNELWTVDVGKIHHIWGNASSPILYKDLVILWCGPGDRQFLLALDKRNAMIVWRFEEPGGEVGKENDGATWVGSWSTPIITSVNGTDELVFSAAHKLKALDPNTGKLLWYCDGLGPLVYSSPLLSDNGVIVAMSGYGGPAMAVQTGGRGNVTQTHRVWVHAKPKPPQRIGTGVIRNDLLYTISEPGTPQCFDVNTGKEIWKQKQLANGQTWSSMVLVDDKLYVVTQEGTTLVLAASPKFEQLAANPLGELTRASLAISNGDIFIRTYEHLWCISEK